MILKQKETRVVSYQVDKSGKRISEVFEVCRDTTGKENK